MKGIQRVYLNGEYVAPKDARIPVFDRGFIFGDGVYEVIPVFGGHPFRLTQHLNRLYSSLSQIGIDNPKPTNEWQAIINNLVAENGKQDQSVYLQITRGPASRDHSFPKSPTPTVFAYSQALTYPPAEMRKQGVSAITVADIRWRRCDIKSTALLANVIMRQQATEQGASESILVRDGKVTEGAASNIFIVVNNEVVTAPKGHDILPGITRDLILELLEKNRVPHRESQFSETDLRQADEVWMTSSTKEILPITLVDGKAVSDGKPGPVYANVFKIYQDYKQAFRETHTD